MACKYPEISWDNDDDDGYTRKYDRDDNENNEDSSDDELFNGKLFEELMRKKEQCLNPELLCDRWALPISEMKWEILRKIETNQVIVIKGGIGCGKTTQVPQYILDNAIEQGRGHKTRIICTQPRVISTISVAKRVAAERAEPLGDSVGYHVKLQKSLCRNYGSILYCTIGILLKYLKHDKRLKKFTHIILDEIHERNSMSDFLITLMKQLIRKQKNIKIILMSATINDKFSQYFNNCPIIFVPGSVHPVTEYYLEDILEMTKFRTKSSGKRVRSEEDIVYYRNVLEPELKKFALESSYSTHVISELRNPGVEELNLQLIISLLTYICKEKRPGAILIFLHGCINLVNLKKNIVRSGDFPLNKYQIHLLHSHLSITEQMAIFDTPPAGVRKIIISTSIAEASITIEDVVYVIDCGRMKLSHFDLNDNLEVLLPEWETLSNAIQRSGRAGRVAPGECYRLYTKARQSTFEEYPTPEIQRSLLEEVILQLKFLDLGTASGFLAKCMDPPVDKAVRLSLELLRDQDAIDDFEDLTPLGHHLAELALDPKIGKMIILGSIFSCVDPIFSIAASMSFKDPFIYSLEKHDDAFKAKLELGFGQFSDHFALAEAIRKYEEAKVAGNTKTYCFENYLCSSTLSLLVEIKSQFATSLYKMNFLKSKNPRDLHANRHSYNSALVKAILCAGLFPNVAVINNNQRPRGHPTIETIEDGMVKIHPSSINAKGKSLPTDYIVYTLKQKSTSIYLHSTTSITEVALIFSIVNQSTVIEGNERKTSTVAMNKCLVTLFSLGIGEIVLDLLNNMTKIFDRIFSNPSTLKWNSDDGKILRDIIDFITNADETYKNTMSRYP